MSQIQELTSKYVFKNKSYKLSLFCIIKLSNTLVTTWLKLTPSTDLHDWTAF